MQLFPCVYSLREDQIGKTQAYYVQGQGSVHRRRGESHSAIFTLPGCSQIFQFSFKIKIY